MTQCKLLGGRYDGDTGSMEEPLPPMIWVALCQRCGKTHWWDVRPRRVTERYKKAHEENGVRFYKHSDLNLDGDDSLLTDLSTPRERELQPA